MLSTEDLLVDNELETISHPGENKQSSKEAELKRKVLFLNKVFNQLWANKKKTITINFLVAVPTILYLLFISKPYYESNVVILPEFGSKSTTLGGLGDLASLAGVNLNNESPTEIYQNLLLSETVLENVINKKYKTEKYSKPVNLIEYFEIEENDSDGPEKAKRRDFLSAYENLVKSRIDTKVEKLTKILSITVQMPESELSAEVANTLVESLDDYIKYKRKSYASQQRFYIEKRIAQVRDSLSIVENQLRNFRDRNRIVEQSPNLFLEQSRLMRNVEIQQAVFIELTKQLEIAKIDEIKETPVINNLEEAKDPVIKAGPQRAKIFLLIMILTFVGSCSYQIFSPQLKSYLNIIKQTKTSRN